MVNKRKNCDKRLNLSIKTEDHKRLETLSACFGGTCIADLVRTGITLLLEKHHNKIEKVLKKEEQKKRQKEKADKLKVVPFKKNQGGDI